MTALGESTYEAVFDHGGQGYGVWFDGVVRDDPMYKQFWKGTGTRPLYVRIEEDRIVLLKEVDIERAPSQVAAENAQADADADSNEGQLTDDVDVDAAIEEAVAEAMAAAEAAANEATGDTEEKVYSPEEAAALFAADSIPGAAPVEGAAVAGDPEPAKPKRRAVRKKAAPKVVDEQGDE